MPSGNWDFFFSKEIHTIFCEYNILVKFEFVCTYSLNNLPLEAHFYLRNMEIYKFPLRRACCLFTCLFLIFMQTFFHFIPTQTNFFITLNNFFYSWKLLWNLIFSNDYFSSRNHESFFFFLDADIEEILQNRPRWKYNSYTVE